MALSQDDIEDFASLLPPELSCNSPRERLLCIVEILKRFSDERHPLSNANIRAILKERFGETPAENTVGGDLRALTNNGFAGIQIRKADHNRGFWCERSDFTTADVHLLLNAIRSSHTLTMRQSKRLQNGLLDHVSLYQEDDLDGTVFVNERMQPEDKKVFKTVQIIFRAMKEGKRVHFQYSYVSMSNARKGNKGKLVAGGHERRILSDDDGNTWRDETPLAVAYIGGNYYVETYSSKKWRGYSTVQRLRVDRMVNTKVSDKPMERGKEVKKAKADAEARLKHRGANTKRGRYLFLRTRSDRSNFMFDRFGFNLQFDQFEGDADDPASTALAMVHISEPFMFYRWLTAAGDGVVIVRPPLPAMLLSSPWQDLLRELLGSAEINNDWQKATDRLNRDYSKTIEEYLAYLDRARSPYKTKGILPIV